MEYSANDRLTLDPRPAGDCLDFREVYEANHKVLAERSMATMRDHAVFGPMIRAASAEQLADGNRAGFERLKRAPRRLGRVRRVDARAGQAVREPRGSPFSTWYGITRWPRRTWPRC